MAPSEPGPMSSRGDRWRRWMAYAFIGVAAAVFVARGPMRALSAGHMSGDLAAPYAATIAELEGRDPYSATVISDVLRARGRELGDDGTPIATTSLYPP